MSEESMLHQKIKSLERSLEFYKSRVQLLEANQSKMRDPERVLVCDILANGQLLPDPDGKRYDTRPNDAKWISVMGLVSIEPMFEPNTKLWWTDGVAVWMASYDSEELHKGTLGRYPTHFMAIEKPAPPKQSREGEEG